MHEHVDFILPAINFNIRTPSPQSHATNMKHIELGSPAPSNEGSDQVQDLPNPDADDSCTTSMSFILSRTWDEIRSLTSYVLKIMFSCLRTLYNITVGLHSMQLV